MDLSHVSKVHHIKHLCFDEISDRHLYMYSFNADDFNALLSTDNRVINSELNVQGLMVNTPKGIKRVKLIKKEKPLNIKYIKVGDSPILSHQIQDSILKAIPNNEIIIFKLIISDYLYVPSDLFLIKREKSIKLFRYCLHKILKIKQPTINNNNLIVSAQSLLLIHIYMGVNPNVFFNDYQLANELDWSGLFKYKIE
jgi:hypothetical protein